MSVTHGGKWWVVHGDWCMSPMISWSYTAEHGNMNVNIAVKLLQTMRLCVECFNFLLRWHTCFFRCDHSQNIWLHNIWLHCKWTTATHLDGMDIDIHQCYIWVLTVNVSNLVNLSACCGSFIYSPVRVLQYVDKYNHVTSVSLLLSLCLTNSKNSFHGSVIIAVISTTAKSFKNIQTGARRLWSVFFGGFSIPCRLVQHKWTALMSSKWTMGYSISGPTTKCCNLNPAIPENIAYHNYFIQYTV